MKDRNFAVFCCLYTFYLQNIDKQLFRWEELMRFYIKYENTAFYGSPQYFLDDESFFYDPWNDTDFSIYIGDSYLSLDIILKSGEVKQFSGFSPRNNWIERSLSVPNYRFGSLYVCMDTETEPGVGIRYSGNFKCFFDRQSGTLCIGNPDDLLNCESVKFAQNTVAAIRDGKLISVWIKPVFK